MAVLAATFIGLFIGLKLALCCKLEANIAILSFIVVKLEH
jgi:hypothetical protein